MNERVNVVA